MNKRSSKFYKKLFSGDFVYICVDYWSKNWFLSKLPKNEHFLLHEVSKITNNQKILREWKMLRICGFHIDFQFWAQKSLPRDLQMDMASPWQLKWASFLAMGLLVQILFSRHSLCIYPYVKTCPFLLRPTFFSKNQPTHKYQV